MNSFFYPTDYFTKIADQWLDFAVSAKEYNHHKGFGKFTIKDDLLTKDPSTAKLFNLFRDVQPRILKTPPGFIFNWHVDPVANRQCVLNLSLTPEVGATLFKGSTPVHHNWCSILELDYKPNRWYLLNTQQSHCFLNLSNQDRYVLSVDINNTDYETALKKIT
jgi:hypothetical protein